jgi:hypothetical protein
MKKHGCIVNQDGSEVRILEKEEAMVRVRDLMSGETIAPFVLQPTAHYQFQLVLDWAINKHDGHFTDPQPYPRDLFH